MLNSSFNCERHGLLILLLLLSGKYKYHKVITESESQKRKMKNFALIAAVLTIFANNQVTALPVTSGAVSFTTDIAFSTTTSETDSAGPSSTADAINEKWGLFSPGPPHHDGPPPGPPHHDGPPGWGPPGPPPGPPHHDGPPGWGPPGPPPGPPHHDGPPGWGPPGPPPGPPHHDGPPGWGPPGPPPHRGPWDMKVENGTSAENTTAATTLTTVAV